MKHALLAFGIGALLIVCACKNDDTPSTPGAGTGDGGDGTSSGAASTDAGGGGEGVDCTHPGAGKPLATAGRCECTSTRNVAGEWSAMRTCREGDLCPTKNKEETIVVTQDGSTITATRGDAYSVSGVLCGDVIVWSGGPKDGLNPECGQFRFSDDTHFLSDSCYVASGDCARTFGQGCPGLKGQCTGTGVKKPEPAAPVQKVICN
jgi:hypothetical protein